MGRFLNADAYASTGQGIIGNNMFVYCGNNPISRTDPTGNLWWVIPIIVIPLVLSGCSSSNSNNSVVVLSNQADEWMKSSQKMGASMAKAVDTTTSEVVGITDSNFCYIWNNITANHVIIHTHGSPYSLVGDGLNFATVDSGPLKVNTNVQFVLITACQAGGNNGSSNNIGQVISKKISADGLVICCTDYVVGDGVYFHPASADGKWVVYQNGQQLSININTMITMEYAAQIFNTHG